MNGKKPRPWIQDRINALPINQAEVARIMGIPNDYLNKSIKGTRPLHMEEALALSKIIGMSMEEIETGIKEKSPSSESLSIQELTRKYHELDDRFRELMNFLSEDQLKKIKRLDMIRGATIPSVEKN